MKEGEKALLALILRLTPSPSSSSSQGWRAEGDADPHGAAHAGGTRSGPVGSLAAGPAWG